MARASISEEIAAVSAICRTFGLGAVTPTILKAAHHTSFLIAPAMLVARVQSAEPIETALKSSSKGILMSDESSQSDEFKEAARHLECDDDEARFDERVKKAGKAEAGQASE